MNKVDSLPAVGDSDHDAVRIHSSRCPKRIPNPSHKVYLYSKADMSSLRKELSKFGDDFAHQAKNFRVQVNWENIKNKISSLMDEFISTKNSTTRHNLPWYNSRLRRSRKLQKLYNKQKKTQSETDKDIFKLSMSDNHQNTKKVLEDY